MIELNDRIIVDITDDLEHFTERRCAFQDINVCMHHVEFKLDNNETIHLKSHQANHFKRAEGWNCERSSLKLDK